MSDKRITPEEVKQAYVDTDMVAQYATMHEVRELDQFSGLPYPVPQHCGCALGTLFRQRTGFYHNEHADGAAKHDAYVWVAAEYGRVYSDGFLLAFDAYARSRTVLPFDPSRSARFNEGLSDGAAVAREVFPVVRS